MHGGRCCNEAPVKSAKDGEILSLAGIGGGTGLPATPSACAAPAARASPGKPVINGIPEGAVPKSVSSKKKKKERKSYSSGVRLLFIASRRFLI